MCASTKNGRYYGEENKKTLCVVLESRENKRCAQAQRTGNILNCMQIILRLFCSCAFRMREAWASMTNRNYYQEDENNNPLVLLEFTIISS